MKGLQKAFAGFGERVNALLEKVPLRYVDMGISALVTVVMLAVYAFSVTGDRGGSLTFLENVELRSLDARFELRGARPADDRIVIVGIDEKTLQKIGAWPIPRSGYADLIDNLSRGGAKVVAFDVTFPTPEKNSAVEAMKRLEAELGDAAPRTVIDRIREIQATSDNDRKLAEAMRRAGNVVLGHVFLDAERAKAIDEKATEGYFNLLWGRPFPQMLKREGDFNIGQVWAERRGQIAFGIEANIVLLGEAAASYGYFNFVPDADGTMRRAYLLTRYRDADWFPILGLSTLQLYENIKDQSVAGYMAPNGLERIEFGSYTFETQNDGSLLVNFVGPYESYKHYSMADVIDGTVPAETFKDKIVLVGATALAIGDLRNTPYRYVYRPLTTPSGEVVQVAEEAAYMGVEIHANVIDNLLHYNDRERGPLQRGPLQEILDVAFILLFGLGFGYLFARLRPLYSTLAVIAAIAGFALLVYLSFSWAAMWVYFVIPVGTLVVNYLAVTSFRMTVEEREKRKIRKSFAQYVSPGVISLIEKDPKKYFRPGGEMKELTIMFSDIRSFTTIAEGLTPDELVHLLNEYLGEMTDILFKEWGTLDKYIGDAIMAFWGSPYPQDDHALKACACALQMSARLDELNLKWEVEGKKQINIGIGINSGPVNVGNMGSDKRLSWTVMGDEVNLSSRLEGATKTYKVRILVAENTYQEAKEHFVFRELDRLKVKGKLKPVAIHELMAFQKDAASYQDLLTRFADALASYRRQKWEEAIHKFEALLERYPDDGPAHVFLKRCHEKVQEAADPVPDWDGVYEMKEK